VDLGGEQQRLAVGGRHGALGDRGHQARIGVNRQVVAMVLECGRGDHDHEVVALGELLQLRPGVLLVAEPHSSASAS
jgi:hypothetical protein